MDPPTAESPAGNGGGGGQHNEEVHRTASPASRYAKPLPRPPKSPAHSAQIRVQNRRREYLERHAAAYFGSMEHELCDPLLYDALIRRFQSAEEREREGRQKGYSRVLEVDLLRGEAKLAQLAEQSSSPTSSASATFSSGADDVRAREVELGLSFPKDNDDDDDAAPGPQTREEGRARWEDFLRQRFILGQDDDFDYRPVDRDDALDVVERRDEEDAWFNEEEPAWVEEHLQVKEGQDELDAAVVSHEQSRPPKLEGETGVQDF